MEIIHSKIQKALVLTFKEKFRDCNNSWSVIPEKEGRMAIGILVGDHFLDIRKNEVYETLILDEKGLVPYVPEIGVPYVYMVDAYIFKSKQEQEELLKKARKMLDIYEERENIVSFSKEKIFYRYRQSYKGK